MVQDLLRKAVFLALPAMLCLCAAAEPTDRGRALFGGPGFSVAGKIRHRVAVFRAGGQGESKRRRAWLQAGLCLGKLGETEAKFRAYRRAIALDPKYADAHYSLGVSLLLSSHKCGAIHELRALKELDEELAGKLQALMDAMLDTDDCRLRRLRKRRFDRSAP